MDPNVSVAFEPGSTMKIFSYMAVMEKGKYNGDETFKSGIFKTTAGTEIGYWNRDGWGKITYDKVFAMSSNVGVVNLIDKYLSKKELMEDVIQVGTGTSYKIEGYDIIVKTGTAQIASEDGTGYLKEANYVIRGFAGLYLKDNPDIIIHANVKKPTPLATLVKEVIENMSKIRNNKPVETKPEEQEKITLSSYQNKNIDQVKQILEETNLTVITLGEGTKIIEQYPKTEQTITKTTKVFFKTDSSSYTSPIIGWSKKK